MIRNKIAPKTSLNKDVLTYCQINIYSFTCILTHFPQREINAVELEISLKIFFVISFAEYSFRFVKLHSPYDSNLNSTLENLMRSF